MMYYIEVDPIHGYADLVRQSDGLRWRFTHGYGDMQRHITQPGCETVAAFLQDRRLVQNSIIEILDQAKEPTL